MRLFWEVVKISAKRQITYRAATLAGLATNFFFGLLRAAVMVALYGTHTQMEGVDLQQAITYTGLAQGSIACLTLFGWYDVMQSVYTGQIGADLLKPMSFFRFWMAQDLGRSLVNFVARGVIVMVFYAVFYDITTPDSLAQWLAFSVALVLAWTLSFCWRFLINLSAFWTPNAFGIIRWFSSISWCMSGFLMPLRFFPGWFQAACYLTPFPHMINTFSEVYLGVISGTELIRALLAQVLWIVVLIIAIQWVLRAGVRRLVIQGG